MAISLYVTSQKRLCNALLLLLTEKQRIMPGMEGRSDLIEHGWILATNNNGYVLRQKPCVQMLHGRIALKESTNN